MNIAIFGDSFANGETDNSTNLVHFGLTQYLMDDGHFVINFSRQGNANGQTAEDLYFSMRQNEHIKWDMAIVFQTEPCRESEIWIQHLQGRGVYSHTKGDIRKVESAMASRFYSQLREAGKPFSIPIYVVGGTVDILEPKETEKFGLKCACQSLVNLCVNGEHTIEEPVTNFVFPFGTGWRPGKTANDFLNRANKVVRAKGTDTKRYFIKLLVKGERRYKLMGDNPEYFAPEENLMGADHLVDHPNRRAYKKLFNHLKSIGIV
jgi:hypothetical protein